MEEAKDNLSKSDETEQNIQMQPHGWRYLQSSQFSTWLVQTMWNECSEFSIIAEGARKRKQEPTGTGRPFSLLPRLIAVASTVM